VRFDIPANDRAVTEFDAKRSRIEVAGIGDAAIEDLRFPRTALYDLSTSNPQRAMHSPRMKPFDADLSKWPTYATPEAGTLKDVTDDYYYGCSCHYDAKRRRTPFRAALSESEG
jgi:hypothetical protein